MSKEPSVKLIIWYSNSYETWQDADANGHAQEHTVFKKDENTARRAIYAGIGAAGNLLHWEISSVPLD